MESVPLEIRPAAHRSAPELTRYCGYASIATRLVAAVDDELLPVEVKLELTRIEAEAQADEPRPFEGPRAFGDDLARSVMAIGPEQETLPIVSNDAVS
jgi:hypothetical protein